MLSEDIFSVENDVLVLNKEYIRGIPEFRVILERDRGSKGDQDGRKKFRAWQEFFYIYISASFFSFANQGGYSEKEVHGLALKEAKLEEDFKPDAAIKACIAKYKEIQLDLFPILRNISTMKRAIKLSNDVTAELIESIQIIMDKLKARKKVAEDNPTALIDPAEIATDIATIDGLDAKLNKIIGFANKLPDTSETLDKLEEKLKEQSVGHKVGRGGKRIGNRAN